MTKSYPIISRELSNTENFMRSRTANGFFKTFQLTGTYSKEITTELLAKALRKILIDYVMLTCNVFKSKDNCYYHPIPNIRFDEVVSIDLNQKFNEEFLAHVNQSVSFQLYCEKPLFKVWLLEGNQLCAAFEHTIADGVAGANFHEILLENFADIDENPQLFEQNYGSIDGDYLFEFEKDKHLFKYSINPPVDPFLEPFDVDYTDSDPEHYTKVLPEGYTKRWQGRFLAKREANVAYKFIHFTPQEVSKILKKCKERKVTMTSYIALIHALTVQDPFVGDDTVYCLYKVALNLRKFFPTEPNTDEYTEMLRDYPQHKVLGTHAHMGLAENMPPIKTFEWDRVELINSHLRKTVVNNKVINISKPFIDVAHKVEDNSDFFNSQLGKPRPDTVKISNLGLIKAKKGDWEITNMVFAQDMAIIAAEFMLNVVSTPLGGLNFVWSFIQDDKQDFTGVDDRFKENMLKYVE